MNLWLFCIALGSVFGVAGFAKLRDPAGATEALTQFGIPSRVAPAARIILPIVELAVAAALFVPWSAAAGAAIAAGLLVAFSFVVAVRLARGEHPDCNCFGRLGRGRIGAGTLVRNGALLTLAAVIAAGGWGHPERLAPQGLAIGLTAREWLALSVGILLVAAVAVQGWLLLKLMSRHGRMLARVEQLEDALGIDKNASEIGLPIGTPAPAFSLDGVHGETITLESLLAPGNPVMLMFTDPGCGPCSSLMPDVARWQREMAATITIAVMTRGDRAVNRAKATEHGLVNVLVQDDREMADAYGSPGTPSAVLIGREGTIDGRMIVGVDAIRALVDGNRGGAAPSHAAKTNGDAHSHHAMDSVGESSPTDQRG